MRNWGLAVLVLAAAWIPARGRACSTPGCSLLHASPQDGATDVPRNVELEILGDDFHLLSPLTMELRLADDGTVVPLEAATTPGRMRAVGGLVARTRYELRGPSYDYGCHPAEVVVLSMFTTGDVDDVTPPTAPMTTAGACRVDGCRGGGCCGEYLSAIQVAGWTATDETALGVSYAFGAPDGPRLRREHGTWVRAVAQRGISGFTGAFDPMPSATSRAIYAIDAAGNVSAASMLSAPDFSCAPTDAEAAAYFACDGGRTCTSDAGASRDGGVSMDVGTREVPMRSSGCGVGESRTPSPPWMIGIGVLVLWCRRELRSRRSPAPWARGPSR